MRRSGEEVFLEKKIYYHDTDCAGVVYYANYLKYLEEARTEFFLSKGLNLRALMTDGIYFVVSRVEIDYKSPARYQDLIRINTVLEKAGFSTLHFFQRVFKEDRILVEARTTLVCVNSQLRPIRIPARVLPEDFLERMSSGVGDTGRGR